MSFSAIVDADTLSAMLDAVDTIVAECKIHLEDDGLEIRAVDPANVAMCDVSLSADAFESYEADGGVIGVDLERLQDVVGFADSGDLVHLELDQETRKLELDVGGLEYTLALIDPDSIRQEPDIPDLDLQATFVFEGDRLDRAVTAADLCSDHVAIEADVDAEELRYVAEGDTDDMSDTLGNGDLLSARVEEDCRSLFSLDYLQDVRKPIGSDTEVSLRLGDEMPIMTRYRKADGALKVQNMLAPRIQSD